MFKHRLRTTLAVLLLAGGGWWLYRATRPAPVRYQTAIAEKGTLVTSVSASGQVVSANVLPVTTTVTGLVTQVFVSDGDRVTAGQKIALITPDLASAQKSTSTWNSYLSAKNTLNILQIKLFSTNQKFINDAVARNLAVDDPTYIQERADWLAAENDYKNQSQVITSAWLTYQQTATTITTPASGVISDLGLVAGLVLTTSPQTVAVVKKNGQPLISVNLSEIDVAKVKIGHKATLIFDSQPDKTFTGIVAAVNRTGITANNVTAYPALIRLDTDSADILSKQSASANIILAAKTDVLLVPNSAIQSDSTIRIRKNNQLTVVSVVAGAQNDTHTEVVSGVNPGDEVITGVNSLPAQSGASPFSSFGRGGFGGQIRIMR